MISSFRGFYFILQNVNRQDALLFSEGAYEIASIVTDDIYQDISLFLLQKKKKTEVVDMCSKYNIWCGGIVSLFPVLSCHFAKMKSVKGSTVL